jgi:CRP-like cAMP-binding protein
MERRRYGRGAVVLARGDADRSLFLIASGSVEVLVHEGNKERRVREQGPGTVLGEVAFFDGMPRSATVRALTDCELFRMGADAFEVLAARHPDLGRRVLLELGRVLAARLRQAEARGGA